LCGEEFSTDEKERLEIKEFLNEMVELINQRFEKQEMSLSELKNDIRRSWETEIESIKTSMESIRNAIESLDEKITKLKENKITIEKEILEKLK